jgi:hypothetical protein
VSRSNDRKRIPTAPVRQEARLEREADMAAESVAAASAAAAHERPGTESAPLASAARRFYESNLGHDFSRVRIHTGEAAADAAASQGALAYTVGEDVVLGEGYAPGTPAGRALLAHELVHTEQQRGRTPALQKQGGGGVLQSSGSGVLFSPRAPLARDPLGFSYADLQRLSAQRAAPVRRFLQAHLNEMRMLSVGAIITRVRRGVQEAAELGNSELETAIIDWAAENNFTPQRISALPDPADTRIPPPPSSPPLTDSAIVRTVSGAVHAAIDGVGVRREYGRALVSVSGATVGLGSTRGTQVAGTVSWGGTLGIQAERGDFHFEASIGADKWEMKLSFGSDTAVPDLSRLAGVFSEGESAMRHIAGEVGTFRNLGDIPRIRDAIHPYTEPVSDAIEALQGVAQAPRVNVGISASGPGTDPTGGGTGPRPTAVMATLTITF